MFDPSEPPPAVLGQPPLGTVEALAERGGVPSLRMPCIFKISDPYMVLNRSDTRVQEQRDRKRGNPVCPHASDPRGCSMSAPATLGSACLEVLVAQEMHMC